MADEIRSFTHIQKFTMLPLAIHFCNTLLNDKVMPRFISDSSSHYNATTYNLTTEHRESNTSVS